MSKLYTFVLLDYISGRWVALVYYGSLTISVSDPCLLHLIFLFQSEGLRGRLRSKHRILHPLVIPII